MKPGARVLVGLVALLGAGAALAATRRTDTAPSAPAQPAEQGGDFWAWVTPRDLGDLTDPFTNWIDGNAAETETKVTAMTEQADKDRNARAFLQAIKQAEGTANQPDPYRVCFGYRHTVRSLAEHPAVSGEWGGEKLPDSQCKAAGFAPGCVSTAAGAYQFIRPTWQSLKTALNLPDFGPASQDAAALELLRRSGALGHIRVGNLAAALNAARKTWASLPGAGYEQPERSFAYIQTAYLNAGGALA